MAFIQAANGNVFEVDDPGHVEKILRESPVDKSGKALSSAWASDPRVKGAKRWVNDEPEAEPEEADDDK